jgi:hypothetical protein
MNRIRLLMVDDSSAIAENAREASLDSPQRPLNSPFPN